MLLNCGVGEDFLRVPWTLRRSNQSILKEISPGCSLKGLMLKLKLWYFGYLMQRSDSFEKTLMLGKIEGGRRRGWQRMKWLDVITDSMEMSLSRLWWWTGRPGILQSMGSQSQTGLSNWTELILRWLLNTVYATESGFFSFYVKHWNQLQCHQNSTNTFSIIIKENSLSNEMFQWNIILLYFVSRRIMILSQLNYCLFFCLLVKLAQCDFTQNLFLFLKLEWNNI